MDSKALLDQLNQYDRTRKSSADVLNEAMGKYGVPEIRSRVANLRTTLNNTENAINSVDPSVTGRTQGSLVTEAQRQRMVSNERQPLMEQYGKFERGLNTESANENSAVGAARILAEANVNDWNTGRAALQTNYDSTYRREQDEQARQERERAFQEQVRQANEARVAATRSAGGGGGGYALGASQLNRNSGAASSVMAPQIKQQAMTEVDKMLNRRNSKSFLDELQAIAKSAGYGNLKDQAKLELLRAKQPGLFSGGGLNTGRIQALYGVFK